MKHIKLFEGFLNEKQTARAVVDASVVKRGMIAEDYNDEKWIVEKVVPAKDFHLIKKYDESGAMAEGMLNKEDNEIEDSTWLIAVKSVERNETAVFTYEPDGACV